MGRKSRAKAERRRVRLTRPEIEAQMESHLRWLASSARAYDEGFEDEAKRLAVSIRAICHETASSHSLLVQLGLPGTVRFTDTAGPINPANLADTWGLVIMRARFGAGVTFIPALANSAPPHQHPPTSFSSWWNNPVVKAKSTLWSRKALVLALANQDGGAHVDPSLDEDYYQLSRRNLFGAQYVDDSGIRDAMGNPAAAAVRQITYEVLDSFGRDQPNIDLDKVRSTQLDETPTGSGAGASVVLGTWPLRQQPGQHR